MQLETLSTGELAKVFNDAAKKLGDDPVKRFSDKKSALRRTGIILEKLKSKPTAAAPKTAAPRKQGGVNFLGMRTDIVASDEQLKLKREDSIRAEAFSAMRAGATKDQLLAIFAKADKKRGYTDKNPLRRIYEMVRIFCYHYGYGTKSSADGSTIKLVTK